MQPLRIKQIGNLKWSVAFLIAIASVMILAGTASQAQHEDGPGKLVATGTDAAPQVMIDNFVYSPVPLTVKVGTTVTWINHDDIPHTVESTQGKFKSAALDTDDKFSFTFTKPGKYAYYCKVHPHMTGVVTVK